MIDYDFWGIILAVLAIVAPTLLFFSKLDRSLQGLTELIRDFHKSHSVEHRDLTMFLRSEFDKRTPDLIKQKNSMMYYENAN